MIRRLTAFVAAALMLIPACTTAGTSTAAAPRGEAAGQSYVNVMPLGDSITCGYIPNPDRNACLSDGYRKDLWVRLRNVGVLVNMVGSCPDPNANCTGYGSGTFGDWNHEGHSGWTTPRLTTIVHHRVTTYRPEVVLLHAGINDLAGGYETREESLRGIIDAIRGAAPQAYVFVASITYDHRWPSKWRGYNTTVTQVVASYRSPQVRFVPQDLVDDLGKDFNTVDRLHPNACGYAKMAYIWYYYLQRSPVNTTGAAWPTGYYPFGNAPGPCA